jgi:hypothetical protein
LERQAVAAQRRQKSECRQDRARQPGHDRRQENGERKARRQSQQPDTLHLAGDHAAEFRRTASRLHEMQSAAYLAAPHLG